MYKEAIRLNKNFSDAYNNLGNAILHSNEKNKVNVSIASYQKALVLDNRNLNAYLNLSLCYMNHDRFSEALVLLNRFLDIDSSNSKAKISKFICEIHLGDWSHYEDLKEICLKLKNEVFYIHPLISLFLIDHPIIQKKRSRLYGENLSRELANFQNKIKKDRPKNNLQKKIRIGYFSHGLRKHATGYLFSEILLSHNKNLFEIYIYHNYEFEDEITEKIKNFSDKFLNVSNIHFSKLLKIVMDDNINIAIDLNGYTSYTLTNLFFFDIAEIKINYLGYPGTLGINDFNYIIADKILITKNLRKYYSENIIFMPDTYQPNYKIQSGFKSNFKNKNDYNLNENSFVFASFNHVKKICPEVFEIWSKLLHNKKNSLLWLYADEEIIKNNLIKKMESFGISSNRIVFANKVSKEEHLFRHRFIDLYLDTFNYNGHTTTSDALFCKIPVITKEGSQFAARVSSSLLQSIKMSELVTFSSNDYYNLALKLSTNQIKLSEIKNKLIFNLSDSKLFNKNFYTKHLETAYITAFKIYNQEEERFRDFFVN